MNRNEYVKDKNVISKQRKVTVSFKKNLDDITIYNWLQNPPKVNILGMSGIVKVAILKAMEQHLLED